MKQKKKIEFLRKVRRAIFALGLVAIIWFFLIPTIVSVQGPDVGILWLIYPLSILITWVTMWILDERSNNKSSGN